MTDHVPPEELPEITQLFDEYLRERERQEAVDPEAFVARAGADGEMLRRRIEIYERLHDLADTAGEVDGALPTILGRFRILSSAGEGGLGQVFLALDPELGRQVALKVLEPGLSMDKSERAWVLNEARSLARLEHPGVVRVFEVGQAEGRDYVVMEHLTGPTLARVITELRRMRSELDGTESLASGPEVTNERRLAEKLLPFSARAQCLVHIAHALAYCHDRGILHRDIKPANIVFDDHDRPRLIDFGLAHQENADEETKLDITQRLVGSPAYVAPEQVENERTGADPRSDQFSFAVVCYELITLENPFKRQSRATTLDAISRAEPRAPRRLDASIPPDLERVVLHGLAREPVDRYPDLSAFSSDLTAILEHRPIGVAEPSVLRVLRLWLRRNRVAVSIAVSIVVLLFATVLGQSYARVSAARNELRDQLRSIDLNGLRDYDEFQTCIDHLRPLEEQIREVDRSIVGRLVFSPLLPSWKERTVEFSSILGQAVRSARVSADETGSLFQIREWQWLVGQDETLSPEFAGNDDLRKRGTVRLDAPAGFRVELYEQHLMDNRFVSVFNEFRKIPAIERPVQGSYRYYAWPPGSDSIPQVVDFTVLDEWAPQIVLSCRPPRRQLLRDSATLPRGFKRVPSPDDPGPGSLELIVGDNGEDCGFAIPRVRIMVRPVTTAEVMEFLAETGQEAPSWLTEGSSPDLPARSTSVLAEAFGRWAGGRLPNVHELMLATGQGILSLGIDPHSLAANDANEIAMLLRGEWTSDLAPGSKPDSACRFKYSRLELGLFDPDFSVGILEEVSPTDPFVDEFDRADSIDAPRHTGGYGFRLVFPLEDPTLFEPRWPPLPPERGEEEEPDLSPSTESSPPGGGR